MKATRYDLPSDSMDSYANYLLDSIAIVNKNLKYKQGYRILVYAGSDKAQSLKVKERLYMLLTSQNIYAMYKQPTYRIKVGDFTDRLVANRVLVSVVQKEFPNAFVVPEPVSIIRK